MHFMNFALMSQKAARVGEARILFTPGFVAFVWSVVLVHVLVPFTQTLENGVLADAALMVAVNLTLFVSWRRSIPFDGRAGTSTFGGWGAMLE
jgi:hypothetical protein